MDDDNDKLSPLPTMLAISFLLISAVGSLYVLCKIFNCVLRMLPT